MKPFAAVYIFTVILMSVEIGWILTKGNRSKQTFSCVMCQLLLNIWSASQLFQLEAVNVRQLFLSYCIGNTGICWIGTAWLLFSFRTVKKKPAKLLFSFLYSFSAVMWLMSVTNPLHHLFYSTFSMDSVTHGPLFYTNIICTYLCMIWGTFMLCKNLGGDRRRRKQLIPLIFSGAVPLCTNMLYLFGVISTLYDITPLAFSISSILVLLATNRYGFLNVNDMAFDKALESVSEGVAVFGKTGNISYSNKTMENYFSLNDDSTLTEIYSALDEASRSTLESSHSMVCEVQVQLNEKIIRLSQYRHTDKNDKLLAVTVIASDITRYYEMAKQEQDLAEAREKLAVESERNRIAQEVHDTAGHTLTMINSLSKLIHISASQGDSDSAMQYAKEAQELSSQGIAQLRISINNLRHRSENSLITDGLRQLADSVRGIEADLCIQGEDSMKYSFCSNVIYENTREAITNCLKYSSADRMDIIVKLLESSAEVYIFDNGKGCGEIICGNGLKGMKERTEKIGGTIRFVSSADSGFSIIMKFPIMKGN